MGDWLNITMNMRYRQQAVVNTFWYRNVDWVLEDIWPGNIVSEMTAFADVFHDRVGRNVMAAVAADTELLNYTLNVWRRDAVGFGWERVTELPFVVDASSTTGGGTTGAQNGQTNGAAMCAIVRATLSPVPLAVGLKPVSRGYWAVGPIVDSAIDEDGYLINAPLHVPPSDTLAKLELLAARVAETLNPGIPFFGPDWQPCRVNIDTENLLGIRYARAARVLGGTVRDLASFRRSRMPEA